MAGDSGPRRLARDPPRRRLRKASDRTRKLFNAAVFERLDVKDGPLSGEEYQPPFDDIFSVSEFEYGTRVVLRCRYSNFREMRSRLSDVADLLAEA